MMYNVPQFVDVEDKIAGPLTWKQLLWMIAMTVLLLVVWKIFEFWAFLLIGIPVAVFFAAMAFYKPYGQPLINMVIYGITFLFQPKMYIWKQGSSGSKRSVVAQKPRELMKSKQVEVMSLEELESLSKVLDNPVQALENRGENDILKK